MVDLDKINGNVKFVKFAFCALSKSGEHLQDHRSTDFGFLQMSSEDFSPPAGKPCLQKLLGAYVLYYRFCRLKNKSCLVLSVYVTCSTVP